MTRFSTSAVLARRLATAACALAVTLLATGGVAQAAAPTLRIVPAPAQGGSPATAFGHDFCGSASCASVQISLGGNVVATGRAGADGSVALTFVVQVAPGQYTVTATQQNAGSTLTATTGLLVLHADARTTAPPRQTTSPPTASTPPRSTTAAPSATISGDPQPPSSVSGSPSAPGATASSPSFPSSVTTTPVPASTSPSPPLVSGTQPGSGSRGVPGWVWALGAAVVVGAGVALLVRRRATGR